MYRFIFKIFTIPLKIAFVFLINFLFFIIIPLTHNLFGTKKDEKNELSSGPKIIAEMIKSPKKEEKKQLQPRIRQVNSSSGNKQSTKGMDFKFTPDLGVDNGEGVAIEQQGTMESLIFNEGEADEDAVPINCPAPQYPSRARDLGIEGTLDLIITVGIDGKVENIEILSSPHKLFEEEARKTINKWKFKPAQNKSVPVKMKVRQTIEYKQES